MNNFLPTGAATNRFTPSMFLTPQGNVYIIDSALEVANVLEHFMVFHKMFEGEIAKEKNIGKETVQECMWEEIHEMYQDWYNDIDKKIKKY